jgi:DNA-binding transcriptional LysR family regulator
MEDIARSVDLRHLRYFLTVADTLHFGRAAARLGIAQPPLSQQIRRLEDALGLRLFERSNRRVELTDAGRVFRDEATRILADLEGAVEAARRAGRGEAGVLRIAFAASMMFFALPRMIREFRRRYPAVRLELRELSTASQLLGLRTGELDIGFLRQPDPDEDLHIETVMWEPLYVALPRAHRLAGRKRVGLGELAGDPFIMFPREVAPGLHAQVLALCRRADFTPNVVQVSRELYTTVSLVDAGVGVTVVPGSVEKLGWKGVRYIPISGGQTQTRIGMAWRRGSARPLLKVFTDLVRTLTADRRSGAAPASLPRL